MSFYTRNNVSNNQYHCCKMEKGLLLWIKPLELSRDIGIQETTTQIVVHAYYFTWIDPIHFISRKCSSIETIRTNLNA